MIYWSHNREYLHCTYKRILQGFNTVWNYDPCINFQVIPHCMLAVKDLLCFIKKSFATQPESTCIQCYSWSSVQLLPHAMWWHHHCPIILVNIFCTMRYCRMNNYSGSLTLTKLAWNKLSGTDTCINWNFFFFFEFYKTINIEAEKNTTVSRQQVYLLQGRGSSDKTSYLPFSHSLN